MFFNHSYLGDSSLTPALKFVKRARAKKRDERRFKYARVCSPIEISPDSIADMAGGGALRAPCERPCHIKKRRLFTASRNEKGFYRRHKILHLIRHYFYLPHFAGLDGLTFRAGGFGLNDK